MTTTTHYRTALPIPGDLLAGAIVQIRTLIYCGRVPLVFLTGVSTQDTGVLLDALQLPYVGADTPPAERASILNQLGAEHGPGLVTFSANCHGYHAAWATDVVFVGAPPDDPAFVQAENRLLSLSNQNAETHTWILAPEGSDDLRRGKRLLAMDL